MCAVKELRGRGLRQVPDECSQEVTDLIKDCMKAVPEDRPDGRQIFLRLKRCSRPRPACAGAPPAPGLPPPLSWIKGRRTSPGAFPQPFCAIWSSFQSLSPVARKLLPRHGRDDQEKQSLFRPQGVYLL